MSKNQTNKKCPSNKNPSQKSVRRIEIVTRLKDDNGETLFDMDLLDSVLEEKQGIIRNYCYIIHDRDVYEEDTDTHKVGELKPPHIHLLLQFEENQPQKLGYIAQWFNVPENFLQTIKSSWNSACLYQIHFNKPDKFQYDVSDVTSNFDYELLVDKAEAALPKKKKDPSEVDIIIQRILNGEIREYNRTVEIDQMLLVKYFKKIELAFKVRSEHLQATRKERHMDCIFITGPSGCGKTTLARKIAESRGLAYFVSSGSNDIMDGYGQEPCLIIDDIRPSVLGLSDLLKMLDPHLASSVKSRYKNKYLNCDLIVLTTVLNIDKFYENVFSEQKEPITQLKRWCSTYIQMDSESICVSIWNKKTLHYNFAQSYKNNILREYVQERSPTPEELRAQVSQIIPFLEPEEEAVFELSEVPDGSKVSAIKRKPATDGISEEEFRRIMPPPAIDDPDDLPDFMKDEKESED